MVSERNRILDLIEYIESCGIEVNIAKNKARGNRGYFKAVGNSFRIDIAKGLSEEQIVSTLAHEFAHYVHYRHDKTLKSLDFIFDNGLELLDELISATVFMIPQKMVKPLFEYKDAVKAEIDTILEKLRLLDSNFNMKSSPKVYENKIKKTSLKYLLKYDRVKVFGGVFPKFYSIEELTNDTELELYLKLKSKKRLFARINAKIARLNRYYNTPTELFARAFELYVTDKEQLQKAAPNVFTTFEKNINIEKNFLLKNFIKKLYNN